MEETGADEDLVDAAVEALEVEVRYARHLSFVGGGKGHATSSEAVGEREVWHGSPCLTICLLHASSVAGVGQRTGGDQHQLAIKHLGTDSVFTGL